MRIALADRLNRIVRYKPMAINQKELHRATTPPFDVLNALMSRTANATASASVESRTTIGWVANYRPSNPRGSHERAT
ncbi:hypothetical protein AB6A40_003218 [Gnathostoma spinigerum]|uniref:Uncharacterized protein n=1 Tax=Gnathostoma spinigerum TaxID=75299 RepID=A0ABD6EEF4_9BILA